MKRLHRFAGVLTAAVFSPLLTPSLAAAESFAIAAPPAWVISASLEQRAAVATNHIAGGEVFVLLDKQVNAGSRESYNRLVRDIVNENGVQNGARISVRFDPAYQQLTVHHIRLLRAGGVLDRLDRDKIKVLQQERDLERHIYDGSLSAVLFLEDVRVGDRIDYAYTMRGMNPIFGGRHADSFSVQWSLPMQRQRFRLLWPANRTLGIRNHSTTTQPVVSPLGDEKEYLWEFHNPPPVIPEEDTPSWHDAFGWVQLSEFPSWAAVAQWAAELYPPTSLSPDLSRKVEEWKRLSARPEERLLAALQFLQDEVRYLGFEFGPNSHRPTAPTVVFERRFGDCKDKAYLLCAVLREMGIEAFPALVNTDYRAAISDWLPSPHAFDHVVTFARINGRDIWVDPTRSHQRGPLAVRYFPDYGRALLVQSNAADLKIIPAPTTGLPKTTVHEIFTVRGRKEPAELRIVTMAEGADADRLRNSFVENSREEIAKSYLNFYAKQYPKIQAMRPPEFLDQPSSNLVQTIEHYRIDEFWSLTKDKRQFTADFHPLTLGEVVEQPSTKLRSMPLEVRHPHRQFIRTEVRLPEPWQIKEEPVTLASSAGKLSIRRNLTGNVLVMEFDYQSITNVVSPEEMPEYLKTLDRMDDALGYQLTWQNEDAPPAAFQPNWSILLLSGFYSVLLLIGAVLLYRWRPAGPPPLTDFDTAMLELRLEGLGGWLILVAIGLFFSPLRVAGLLVQTLQAYSLDNWHAVSVPGTETYHPLWAPLLIFELLANLTSIALAVLLLVLFFQKRRTFPRLYICYLIFSAVVVALDHFGGEMIPTVASGPGNNETRELVRSIVGCCIWVPYMLVSKRVRLTFVR